jgi:transketolase
MFFRLYYFKNRRIPVMSAQAAENLKSSASHKDMANALRALSMDAVQKANSGHPGMPHGHG